MSTSKACVVILVDSLGWLLINGLPISLVRAAGNVMLNLQMSSLYSPGSLMNSYMLSIYVETISLSRYSETDTISSHLGFTDSYVIVVEPSPVLVTRR